MKNLSHFDEKSQSFWPSQVGRYVLAVLGWPLGTLFTNGQKLNIANKLSGVFFTMASFYFVFLFVILTFCNSIHVKLYSHSLT